MSGEPAGAREDPAPDLDLARRRTRQARRAACGLAAVGIVLTALLLIQGRGPVGVITGQVVGATDPVRVALVDPKRGVTQAGVLVAPRRYRCVIPAAALSPAVVIHGPDGSLVESGVLPLKKSEEAPPLGLWVSPVRFRRKGKRLRVEWSPIPHGEGYPVTRRYSVLFAFRRTDGGRGEATLLTRHPALVVDVSELTDLLHGRDPARRDLEVDLRAFDPTQQQGPMWIAAVTSWTLPRRKP